MPPDLPSKVFILDNGAYSLKAGYATDSAPKVLPNYVTKVKSERIFVSSQLDECKDYSGLFYLYPFERNIVVSDFNTFAVYHAPDHNQHTGKCLYDNEFSSECGFLLNWEIQKQVWDFIFGRDMFNIDFKDTCIIMTEPYFNFVSMQETMTEILFEDYKFHSILRINPSALSAYHCLKDRPSDLCCTVVDSGFSFSHIVPHIQGKKHRNATRRIQIGGKLLTNYLKEIVSYRQLNVMDETYVMNQVKEDVCYVSNDYWNDLKICQKRGKENTIVQDYVLPDYSVIKRGYVRSVEETSKQPKDAVEQFIRLNNERFQVPELLFHPSDINIAEMGICEAIENSIQLCPEYVQPHMYKNILLTGGNTFFPGFKDRVTKDVRTMCDDLFDINVMLPNNPVTYAWEGGALLSRDPEFSKMIVTRKQFEEHFVLEKFDV